MFPKPEPKDSLDATVLCYSLQFANTLTKCPPFYTAKDSCGQGS